MLLWYVINTKPKKEAIVERLFREGGFGIYNPKYRDGRLVKPFFPGYEFVEFSHPEQFKIVKYTRGVKRIVGNDSGPIPVETVILDQIRSREVDGFVEFSKHGIEPALGDEIEVAEGPFRGLRGIFTKDMSDQDRVLVLLNYVSYQGQLIIEKTKLKKVIY